MSLDTRLRRLAAAIPHYDPGLTLAGVPGGNWFIEIPRVAGGGYVNTQAEADYFSQATAHNIKITSKGGAFGFLDIIGIAAGLVVAAFSGGVTLVATGLNVAGKATGNQDVQKAGLAASLAGTAAGVATGAATFFSGVGSAAAVADAGGIVAPDIPVAADVPASFATAGTATVAPDIPLAAGVPTEFAVESAPPAARSFFGQVGETVRSLPGSGSPASVAKEIGAVAKTTQNLIDLLEPRGAPVAPLTLPLRRKDPNQTFLLPIAGGGVVSVDGDLVSVAAATGQPGQIGGGGGGGDTPSAGPDPRVVIGAIALVLVVAAMSVAGRRAR